METGRIIGLAAAASLLLCMHTTSGHAGWLKVAQGDGEEVPYEMARSADGSYAIVGSIKPAGAAGKWDAGIWKLNARGELNWARSIGGSSDERFWSVTPASGGGYVALGYSKSLAAAQPIAALLAKFDASGALQWQRAYSGGIPSAGTVFATSDGGYVFGGSTNTSAGGEDALVVKTDGAGNVSWARTFDYGSNHSWEAANSVIQTSDGGYFVAGSTDFFTPGVDDALLIKLDGAGNVVWSTAASIPPDSITVLDSVQTTDGGFVCVGDIASSSSIYTGWALKVSSIGMAEWHRVWDSSVITQLRRVERVSGGDLVLVGLSGLSGVGSGGGDAVVVRLDALGLPIWEKAYGTANWDGGMGIASDGAGAFVISAFSEWTGAGSLEDLLIMSIDGNGSLGPNCAASGFEHDLSVDSSAPDLTYTGVTLTSTANTFKAVASSLSTGVPITHEQHLCGDDPSEPNLIGAWTALKKKGSSVNGTVWISNSGSLDAASFIVSVYFSRGPNVTSKSVRFSTSPIAALAAGSSTTLKVNAKPPKRSKYVIAVIDSHADIVESDESDNIASRAY